jgi:hypothetical protein
MTVAAVVVIEGGGLTRIGVQLASMSDEPGRHPDEGLIEQYSLGVLAAEAIPAFEQHVLVCHDCQDRVAEMDAQVQGMVAAAREERAQEASKRGQAGSSA